MTNTAGIAALALLIGTAFGGFVGYRYATNAGEAAMQAHLANDAAAGLAANVEARKNEYELGLSANRAAESYEQGKRDAEHDAEKTAAELLTGTLRLQNLWAGCEAGRMSDASAAAGKLNAAKRERAQSAGRIIAAASACDAQVKGLQALVAGERQTVARKP